MSHCFDQIIQKRLRDAFICSCSGSSYHAVVAEF